MFKQAKAYLFAGLIAAFIAGGFYIKELRSDNFDLKEQVEQIETTRENEIMHFNRESERLEALNELKSKQEVSRHEASKDLSDGSSTFGISRVRRVNEFK